MPPAKSKISSIAALNEEFETRRFKMRGQEFVLRELSISDYDKLVAQCTSIKVNSEGEEEEVTDNRLLIRLLIDKSMVQPKTLPSSTRLVRALEREVQDLHFGLEPIERPSDDGEYPSMGKVDDGLGGEDDEDDADPQISAG